ncbi:hypothetical protein J6590_105958, partial [Homalodisca vitripennis]
RSSLSATMRQPCRAAAAVVWQRRAGQSILFVAANCTLWWFLVLVFFSVSGCSVEQGQTRP